MPFKIYRSSAGSGKTFTLVKEYLRIALSSEVVDNYRGILAITFTNKAAEEMKLRVITTLQTLSENVGGDTMMAILERELGLACSQLAKRAKIVLRHMLHHYSDISIGTIDGFSHRLVRTFAHDLGLSVNFEVELDTEHLAQEVYDRLMQRVGSDKALTAALVDVVSSVIDDERGWDIEDRVKKSVDVLFSEESRFHLNHLRNISLQEFGELRKKLKVRISTAEERLQKLGTEAIALIADRGLSTQGLAGGKNGIHGFFNKLKNRSFQLPGKTVIKNVEADKWYGSKSSEHEKRSIDNLKPGLLGKYEEAVSIIRTMADHAVVFKHLYGVALLDEMHRILTDVQLENEVVHISEFNHLIGDVVMDETAPYIYERLGSRFHHFLIDEFQDTSVLQWFNLLPLIDESLARENLCLVVGDAKQSIYRWRGGDVQQFVKLPGIHRPAFIAEKLNTRPELLQQFNLREQNMTVASDIDALPSNYRSRRTIVDFNNRLFAQLKTQMPAELNAMYAENGQLASNEDVGLVTVKMLEDGPAYTDQTLHQLLGWIEDCVDNGFALGDIALIFRRNKEAIKAAKFLIEQGFPVVSRESLLINSSAQVRLLINVATFVVNPNDTVNTAELIHHLNICRPDSIPLSIQLGKLNQGDHSDVVKASLRTFFPSFSAKDLRHRTPYTLFAILIHELFGSTTDTHVRFFMDEVLSFSRKDGQSLQGFLDHWSDKRHKLSVTMPSDGNAISIMTIHKSKGLEFPVVMHPFADYPDRSQTSHIWAYLSDDSWLPLDRIRISNTKALEGTRFGSYRETEESQRSMDMFNELYVALTRAKDRLYVSGKLKKSQGAVKTAIDHIRHHLIASGLISEEDHTYTAGASGPYHSSTEQPSGIELSTVGNPYWIQRLRIADPAKRLTNVTSGTEDPRLRGIAAHEALANIRTEKDVDKAVQDLMNEGRITESQMKTLESRIRKLIDHPTLQPLFSSEKTILNEADVHLSDGRWLRPDRIVMDDSRVWVIDYKTGDERQEHHRQVAEYKLAVTELGYEKVEGLLVYLDTEKVVSV